MWSATGPSSSRVGHAPGEVAWGIWPVHGQDADHKTSTPGFCAGDPVFSEGRPAQTAGHVSAFQRLLLRVAARFAAAVTNPVPRPQVTRAASSRQVPWATSLVPATVNVRK